MISSSWKSRLAGVSATCYLSNQSLWRTVLHLMVCEESATLGAEAMGTVREDKIMTPLFLSLCLELALGDESFLFHSGISKDTLSLWTRVTMPKPESHFVIWLSVNWRGQEWTKHFLELNRCMNHSCFSKCAIWVSNNKGVLGWGGVGEGIQVNFYFTGIVSSSPDCGMFVTATPVTAFPQTESMLGAEKGELLLKLSPHSKVLNLADPCPLTSRACLPYQGARTPLVDQVRRSQIW